MHVNGDLVTFLPLDHQPIGIRKVGEVPENTHDFWGRGGELFMRDCVEGWWLIDGDWKHLRFKDISYDFERAADRSTGEGDNDAPSCNPKYVSRRPNVSAYRRRQ